MWNPEAYDAGKPGLGGRRLIPIIKVVAAAFLRSCPKGHVVQQIDGDARNFRADNLRYVVPVLVSPEQRRQRGKTARETPQWMTDYMEGR